MATKKKTIELQGNRRLMNRWLFEVANKLIDEGSLSRKVAFQQALLTRELLDSLGRGEVRFVYEKQDGTLREARGTLRRGISKAFDNYNYKHVVDDLKAAGLGGTSFPYWDLDREAFRTFAVERIKKIIEVRCK